jgi:RNA-directed DNA polymerase
MNMNESDNIKKISCIKEVQKKKQYWHNINWRNVHSYVSKLQLEMVVAYKNNDWKKIFFLQNKLIMSFEGRALAVRRIVTNNGNKTPGIDEIVWSDNNKKYGAISELRSILVSKSGSYKSSLISRVWIPKSTPGEIRPLGIPTMIDRALQALILLCLDPVVEEMSDTYSFGSRKFRGTHDAIQRIRTILDKIQGPKWVWDVDVSKCFDEISHKFLEKILNKILCKKGNELVRKWLKAPIIDRGTVTTPKQGTPQGCILSPLLCNITLNGLENVIRDGLPSPNSKKGRELSGSWLVRYVDDFIDTSFSKERLIEKNIPKVKEFLAERGLQISEKKSKIVNLEKESFNFLG